MNIVVGDSIKIQTCIDIHTELFKEKYFNKMQLSLFIFNTIIEFEQLNKRNNLNESMDDRITFESLNIKVDARIINCPSDRTELLLFLDLFDEDFDVNRIIENIVENSELIINT